MVPPTLFISGGVAVLQLCKEVYVRFQYVKRFREDCRKLAYFVHRIEALITETEDNTDMTAPGWADAFSALHESLLEVVQVFEDCARYGLLRSLINADELNLRWSSIAQRLMLALQLLPIQKAKATDKRLAEIRDLQSEIRAATFVAVRAAEEQSAALKKLMDQSRVDATKTQEMLAQVLLLLQTDASVHIDEGGPVKTTEEGVLRIDPAQLEAEVADLHAERERMVVEKKAAEEEYLAQVIAAITAMEAALQGQDAAANALAAACEAHIDVPPDLRCPITYQLLRDPVILVDNGQTYERSAITEWLDRGNFKDPVSGVQLESKQLVPNILVRKLAQEWLKAHPEYLQQPAAEATQESTAQKTPAAVSTACQPPSSPNVCCKAAAAAAAVVKTHKIQVERRGSQSGASLPCLEDPTEAIDVFPKTAAILEAGSKLDPTQCSLAQQAYAAVVAAAAAADRRASQDAASSHGADVSAEPHAHAGHAGRPSSRTACEDAYTATSAQASAAAAAVELQQQQQQQQLLQQHLLQQQQPSETEFTAARRSYSSSSSSLPAWNSYSEEAAAAAGALQLQDSRSTARQLQQHNSQTLSQLHTTLSRAAQSRQRIILRDRPDEAETESVLSQQQQERQQQRLQQQELAYLQQHMEQLMRSQSGPHAPRQPSGSSSGGSSSRLDACLPRDQYAQQLAGPSVGRTGSMPARESVDLQPHCDSPRAGSSLSAPPRMSYDAAYSRYGQHYQHQQYQQLPCPTGRERSLDVTSVASAPSGSSSGGSRTARKGSWSSSFGLGRRASRQSSEVETASMAASLGGEDAASVSSANSGDSKRSVGKSVLGMLKKVQYTMVYQQEHC